jgi:hypothetical protein
MTQRENGIAIKKTMAIAARIIADQTAKSINKMTEEKHLQLLHPYAAQYLLEETVAELGRRI